MLGINIFGEVEGLLVFHRTIWYKGGDELGNVFFEGLFVPHYLKKAPALWMAGKTISGLIDILVSWVWLVHFVSQVPTECERSPSLWRHAQERASSWDATCLTRWTESPMWWSGSSMECQSLSSSTFASILLMWTQNMPVNVQNIVTPMAFLALTRKTEQLKSKW